MLLENFKELSFKRYISEFLFVRIVTNSSSKYEMFSLVGHLGESLFFSSSLNGTDEILQDSFRIYEISEILKLLLIFKLSFLKLFGTA